MSTLALLVFIASLSNILASESSIEIYNWNVATKVWFNSTTKSYDDLTVGITHDHHHMHNTLGYGDPRSNWAYRNKQGSHFNIFLNLFLERRINEVTVVTNTLHLFELKFSGKTKCKYTHHINDGKIHQQYACNKLKSQYVEVTSVTTSTIYVFDVIVRSPIVLLSSKTFPNAALEELSHPYSSPTDQNYSYFAQNLHNFTTGFFSFSDTNPQYLQFYDYTIVLWFSIKCADVMIFDQLVIETHVYDFPDFHIKYQTNDDRKFIDYKENNEKRIFSGIPYTTTWFFVQLENPMLAKSVKCLLLQYVTKLTFKINMRGYKTIFFQESWSMILLSTDVVPGISKDGHLSATIELGGPKTVVGLLFDNHKIIEEFFLMYTDINGTLQSYKDQPSHEQLTFFRDIRREVILRTFQATHLHFPYLKLNDGYSQFSVHVKGKETLESFYWAPRSFIPKADEDDIYVIKDEQSSTKLYSTESNFEKKLPEHRIFSDHIGDDCLTRPDICVNGFTVQFRMKGKLNEPLFDTYSLIPQHLSFIGKFEIRFEQVNDPLIMFFHNAFQYSYAKIVSSVIDFKIDETLSYIIPTSGEVNINLISTIYSDGMTFSDSDYDEPFICNFDNDNTRVWIDLTSAMNKVLQYSTTEVRHIQLKFYTQKGLVRGVWDTIKMTLKTRVIVPKSVKNLDIQRIRMSNKLMKIVFHQPRVLVQVCLLGDNRRSIMFQYDYISRLTLFEREEPMVFDKMKTSEFSCFDLPYPVILTNHFYVLVDANNYFNVIARGADIDFQSSEVFPIISAGIHGDRLENIGTGFSIFYDDKNLLHGLVKTNTKIFHVQFSTELVKNDSIIELIWTTNNITLQVDGQLIEYNEGASFPSSPNITYEYLLIFGNYHNIFTYTHVHLLYIKIFQSASKMLMSSKSNLNDINLHKDVVYTEDVHINYDGCINVICPEYDYYLDETLLLFHIGKIPVYDVVDNILVKNEIGVVSKTDENINLAFLNVLNPLRKGKIHSIYLLLKYDQTKNVPLSCQLLLLNSNKKITLSIPNNTSVHRHEVTLLVKEAFLQSENLIEILEFSLEQTSCFVSGQNFVDGEMEIRYSIGSNYQPGLVSYAHRIDQYSSIFSIDVIEIVSCIRFTYIFNGDGFAYISVIKSQETNINNIEYVEVFRRYLNNNHTEEQFIDVPINSTDLPMELRFAVVKSGFGKGYFRVVNMSSLDKACIASADNVYVDLAVTWDKIINRISGSGFETLELISSFEPNPKPVFGSKHIINKKFNTEEMGYFETPFGTTQHYYVNGMSFEVVGQVLREITLIFWMYWDNNHSNVLTITLPGEVNFFETEEDDGKYLKLTVFGKDFLYSCCSTPRWLPIVITTLNGVFHIEVDRKIIATNQPLGVYGDVAKNIKYHMSDHRHIFCLQVYHEALSERKILQALLCPSRFIEKLCDEKNGGCALCNQINGELDCHSTISNKFSPAVYNSMDDFILLNSESIQISARNSNLSNIMEFDAGILTDALHLLQEDIYVVIVHDTDSCTRKCTLSVWLNHMCSENDQFKFVISNFLIVQCSKGVVEFVTTSCGYAFETPNGFWYHVVVTINNAVINDLYINGEKIVFTTNCLTIAYENENQVGLGFGGNISVDEMLLAEDQIYSNEKVKELYEVYFYSLEIINMKTMKKNLPLWIKSSYNEVIYPVIGVKGTESYQNFTNFLKEINVTDVLIDVDSMRFLYEGSLNAIQIPIYVRKFSDEIFKTLQDAFVDSHFTAPEIVKDLMTDANELEILETQKHFIIVHWRRNLKSSGVIILGVEVEVILIQYLQSSSVLNSTLSVNTFTDKKINISGLTSFAKYQIELRPILPMGTLRRNLSLDFSITADTLESEPSQAPDITCEPNGPILNCTFNHLDEQSWHGYQHSYDIACLLESSFEESGVTSLFDLNITFTGLQVKTIDSVAMTTYYTSFNATEIYEPYVIEIRATTRGGLGKGVSLQKTFRSQQGAPDHFPENFQMSYRDNRTFFSWESYINDNNYWNTNDTYNNTWLFQLALVSMFHNITKYINTVLPAEAQSGVNYAIHNPDDYADVIGLKLLAQSNMKASSVLQDLCFIVPSDKVPYVNDSVLNAAVKDHQLIRLILTFPKFYWRGIKKYLYIVAFANREGVEQLAESLIKNDYLNHSENITEENTYLIESHLSYWIRVYRHFHFTNDDIETNDVNKVMSCSNETMRYLIETGRDNITMQAFLNGLHPYTEYIIYSRFCNGIGCSESYSRKQKRTEEYEPTNVPQNSSITATNDYSMLLNWSTVDEFYKNGEIKNYHVRYINTETNISVSIDLNSTVMYYITPYIGKYKEVCFQVAASTSVGIGPYSNMTCNYSMEAAPDAIPRFHVIEKNSSSFTIQVETPKQMQQMNGILRAVLLSYNTTLTDYINKTYIVNHTNFFQLDFNYTIVLGNLSAFMDYFISLSFVTVESGKFSKQVLNRTGIDAPFHPPRNFSVSYDAFTINASWERLASTSWNGPPYHYLVIVNETLLDQSVNTTFYFVDPQESFLYLNNLRPYRYFNLSISACTKAGCSDISFRDFQTLEAEPCPPKEILLDESLTNKLCLYWPDIDEECKNGVISGYVIYVQQITAVPYVVENEFELELASGIFEHCIGDIPMGRIYNISISGKTGAGVGTPSNELSEVFGQIINGNWTLWTKWTPCTTSCDNGTRSRQRFCSNPTPVNGLPCQGDNNKIENCTLPRCEGVYLSAPGDFNCSDVCEKLNLRCSGRMHTFNNTDIFTKKLGLVCSSKSEKWKSYSYDYHPAYDLKHKACEGYVMRDYLIKCDPPNDGESNHIQRLCDCEDPASEGLTSWFPWSPCTAECGESLIKTRKRICRSGFQCSEDAKTLDEQNCGLKPCPINGEWSGWYESTRCSKSCDGGYKVNVRTCTNPSPDHGGEKCRGPSEDEGEVCNAQPCPVDGGMSLWTEWSGCHRPCGNAKRTRERFCNNPFPAYKGKPCNRTREIEETSHNCNSEKCPEVGVELTIAIANRDWHFTMYQVWSSLAIQLTENVCKNINVSLTKELFLTKCYPLAIRQFRQNAVVPTIKLVFSYVDREQIVALVDKIEKTNYLTDLNVVDFAINTTSVPYEPPRNIHVAIINQTSVNVTWSSSKDDINSLYIYIIFTEDETAIEDISWNIKSVPATQRSIVIYYLKPNQLYRAYLVRSNKFGNGIPSEKFFIQTESSPPSVYPFHVSGFPLSSTSIYISWKSIPNDWMNGVITGYKIKYKRFDETLFQTKIIENGFVSSTVTGLEAYMLYQFDVLGVSDGGDGPADYVMVKTLEGVPSVPVPGVKVRDMKSIKWWSVLWTPLPKNKIHGILRGYRLKYYMSYRSDIPIGGEINWIVKDFDKFTFYHKEKNLLNYATYNLTVTGFTNAGEGPTPEHFAKTCLCKRHLFANWYELPPYAKLISAKNLTGIFPDLLKELFIEACGSCAKYQKSILHLYKTKHGENAMKQSDYELKLSINDDVDVSFPYYERITTQAIVPESIFLPIIKSTGCAFITRDEINLNQLVIDLILNVIKVWPLLIVGYAIAALCGILIWATDQFMNPAEFNLGGSIRGPCVGFWFSFITMTTVGYGDLVPKSKSGRFISVIWFMVGLILNSIIVGFITTSLTSFDQPETAKLYNTKSAALNKSYEYRFAVRRNADVSDKQYTTIDEMLDDLENKKVDAVLVDLFSMIGYKEKIKSRYLKVKTILDTQTAYGIILSGQSVHLKKDIESQLYSKQNVLTDFIKSIEEDIPGLSESKRGDIMQLVFGAKSEIFQTTAIRLVQILAALIFLGIIFEIGRYVRKRQKVNPENECQSSLEIEVERFVKAVTDKISTMDSKQEKERVRLVILNHAVKNLETKVGKEVAWARIRWLWDS